jgi:Flp pilus assembly protein TadB
LTTPANFDAAITVDTTLYAKWTAHPVLATTGVAINPLTIPLAVTVVVLGALLIAFAALRRRRNRNRLTEQDEQV